KMILVEENPDNARDLKARLRRDFPSRDAVVLQGDCNQLLDGIIKEMPDPRAGLLSFCFIDPRQLGIHFETIRQLASRYWMDFLILIADQMAGGRDVTLVEPENQTV